MSTKLSDSQFLMAVQAIEKQTARYKSFFIGYKTSCVSKYYKTLKLILIMIILAKYK